MSFRVRVPETGEAFEADDLETLLASALRAGVKLPCDCRQGACGTCRVRLLEGSVEYDEEPMGLSTEEAAAGFALACQARPVSDLAIRLASTALQDPVRQIAVVREINAFTTNVVHLTLDVAQAEYLPGQYMKVHLADGTTRNFSMASMSQGTGIDFHVRRIPGGQFTDALLKHLRPGDKLDVELPHGSFFYRQQDYRPLLMVATGTGLAPIRSILESLLDDPDCPPVTLYWGMRTASDLYLNEELLAWESRLSRFKYIPVLSQPDGAWTHRRGRVQQAVADDFPDLSEHAIYMCGSPTMVTEARRDFIAIGANPAYVYADGFSFQISDRAAESAMKRGE